MKRQVRVGRREVMVTETLVDRVVGYLNPRAGLDRLGPRVTMEAAGGYRGGRRDRRNLHQWRPEEAPRTRTRFPICPISGRERRDLARNITDRDRRDRDDRHQRDRRRS